MNPNALISIIVPVYGVEPYLKKCVDSILGQTYRNLEVILVDDGSPDNCGAICDAYAEEDERIVVLHQRNAGQASARNQGLSIAKGDYIAFVDSDDWISERMMETMLNALQKNECEVAICGRFSVAGDTIKESAMFTVAEETVMDTNEAIERFLTYKAIDSSPCDKLYKKDLLDGVRFPVGYICEDAPFVFSALAKAQKVVHCAQAFYYYLHREGSTSRSSFSPKTMGLYYNFKEVQEKSNEMFPQLKKEADFLFLKNLIVLSYRIAQEKEIPAERTLINGEIRKNFAKIRRCEYLKDTYKLFAVSVKMHIERIALRIGCLLGFKLR